MTTQLTLKSHVGRDLLQTAQVFKNEMAAVWEYVANSLQYHEAARPPIVWVAVKDRDKSITISDKGTGMDRVGLAHFFTMHAENRERKAGRIGRGLFGTGKSAAFGIGGELTVTSVRSGLRNIVALSREAVEAAPDGSEVPLEEIVTDEPVDSPNGTVIEIGRIHLKRIDRERLIQSIERRLAAYPRSVEVYVGTHRCAFNEPEALEHHEIAPTPPEREDLGDAKLVIKVAKSPLDSESQGVQVFSYGNWISTTLAGLEGREMTEFIFGEVDVPALEEYQGPVEPFDHTRSGLLNPSNQVVSALYRFLGPHIEKLRRKLVSRKREAAKTEQARQLSNEAKHISNVLNEDFADFRRQLQRSRAPLARKAPSSKGDADDEWVEGGEDLAIATRTSDPTKTTERDGRSEAPPDLPGRVIPNDDGNTTGSRREGGRNRIQTGGIDVEYQNLGIAEHRARFIPERRVMLINLEHPELSAALKGLGSDVRDPRFTALSWDVAFAEYAVALARMREDSGHYVDAQEPLFDIRETIDRLTRRVYASRAVRE